ncbi:hypothetical protein [Oceanobacillus saliphilus]|uniref:hypothetical protein n=1 Tax=Oceanobacillus saliphilus TaxID=2925834 RepID=UPI00201E4812|nr:hypothetical protein [Oceanobacillus saliphilus]
MKNKKLIIINLLTLTAFLFVVSAGIQHAEATKDEYGENDKKVGEEEDVVLTEENVETLEITPYDENMKIHTPTAFVKRGNAGALALKNLDMLSIEVEATDQDAIIEELTEVMENDEDTTDFSIDIPESTTTWKPGNKSTGTNETAREPVTSQDSKGDKKKETTKQESAKKPNAEKPREEESTEKKQTVENSKEDKETEENKAEEKLDDHEQPTKPTNPEPEPVPTPEPEPETESESNVPPAVG